MERISDFTNFKHEYIFKKLNKEFKITFSINDRHELIYILSRDINYGNGLYKELKLKDFLEKDYDLNSFTNDIANTLDMINEYEWNANDINEFAYFLRNIIKEENNVLNFIFKRE